MKLLLNGGGGSEELKPALKILDKIMDHNKPMLYIPLAMDEAAHPYDECYKWFQNAISGINICKIDMVRSFEELSSLNLDKYSSIFIGGGNTYKLLKGIKDNNIFEKINEYLNNGGIIMGGSAGAVIFGKDINIIASMDNNEVDLKDTKGFDCLNGISIFPHYINTKSKLTDEENNIMIEKYTNAITSFSNENGEVIAIPEEDTIYIHDEIYEVIGAKPYYKVVNGKKITCKR